MAQLNRPAALNTETVKESTAALEQQKQEKAPAAKQSPNYEHKPAEPVEDNHG
jgi:hypothetical protein